jgi:hypothetical protein
MAEAPLFVGLCNGIGSAFASLGRGRRISDRYREAFRFLGWELGEETFAAALAGMLMLGILAAVLIDAVLYALYLNGILRIDANLLLIALLAPFLAALFAFFLFQRYPMAATEREKMRALGYIPEIVNYLVMSMRLTPNLERAVEFAASHGRGRIAEDMRALLWDVQMGKYLSIEEGLDELAYRWGDYSEEFKHALMLIRSSVLEIEEEKRDALLEKAVADVLEGSKEKMDLYARKLHQPVVYLYYFGILLPLLLAIVLPISSAMLKSTLARPEYLILAYNVALPVLVLAYGRSILAGRPPTNVPPEIPEDMPGLPRKGTLVIAGIALPVLPLAVAAAVLFAFAGYSLQQAQIAAVPEYLKQSTDYEKFDMYLILPALAGITLAASIYLLGAYWARKKKQDEIRAMEAEFKDAIYVLASRLGENRPIEDAFKHSVEFLPKSVLARDVFARIVENVTSLGMTVKAAMFDSTFGALKDMPSQTIRGGMRIMTDSVELGVNVAAKSLIALSLQLRDAQRIDEMLRKLLEDITTMLKTMSTFVAPVVLGIIAAMQRVIIASLQGLGGQQAAAMPGVSVPGFGATSSIIGMFSNKDVLASAATSAQFTVIMGVYVIEITALLAYLNAQIEDGGNKLHAYVSIAKALPVAIIIYSAVAFFAGTLFSSFG